MSYGVGALLIAAVGGYWVLERAARQKGNLKKVGQVLGAVIILVSLIGVACKVWCITTCPTGAMGKGRWCPMTPKSPGGPMM
jgi:hypothetical protein